MIPQTPWFERKFAFNFPVGLFPVIIERLRGTLARVEAMTKNTTDEKLSRKMDGSWSIKEQVGHLYDLDGLWYGRIEDFLSRQQTLRAADLRNTKTHEANHNQKAIQELISQFSSARNKLIEKVQDIDEATVLLTALHHRLQTTTRISEPLFCGDEND